VGEQEMELPFDLDAAQAVIGLVTPVLAALGIIFGWFGKVWQAVASFFRKEATAGTMVVPKETVRLVPALGRGGNWWHMASISNQPAMQISLKLSVTNISDGDVYLMGAKMRKPPAVAAVAMRAQESDIHGGYMIPKGCISQLIGSFWIQPPVRAAGQPFKTDVAIIDQFGNEHWLTGVEFRYQ
jgi:hypothetical protein